MAIVPLRLRALAAEEPSRLFPAAEYPDKVLRSLGVDEEILPIIRLMLPEVVDMNMPNAFATSSSGARRR